MTESNMAPTPRWEIRERKNAAHYPFVIYDREEAAIVAVESDREGAERSLEFYAAYSGD